jgi:hypothetical protein
MKIMAFIIMVIDHVGLFFFPGIIALRMIGRLALPIFCYFIANGYSKTKSLKKYILSLTITALFVQIAYVLMGRMQLNILFGFIIALLLLYLKDNNRKLFYFGLIMTLYIDLEYGIYSILLVLIFNIKDSRKKQILLFIIVTFIYSVLINSYIQFFAVVSLLLIYLVKDKRYKLNKYVFYAAYPLHLYVLILIYSIINK